MPYDATLTVESYRALTNQQYAVHIRVVVNENGTERFNEVVKATYDKNLEEPIPALSAEIVQAARTEWKKKQAFEQDKQNVQTAVASAEAAIEGLLNP